MENSLSSCINKTVASKGAADFPEESGWTKYLEDFSNYRGSRDSSSSFHSSSFVTDAASSAAWKISNNNDLKVPKILGFKNTRSKMIDDSLEDTASSPVNSSKVSDLEPVLDMKPIDQMKGFILEHCPDPQADKRSAIKFGGMTDNNDSRNLRKMGPCLVPLSKLVNYFG